MPLDNVRNIVLVLSGKGGVGKSSITTQLALTLSLQGHTVGVLDIDLTGPSIPRFFGIEESKVRQAPGGWVPVDVHAKHTLAAHRTQKASNGITGQDIGALSCMSLGFILANRSDAVIWRGPKKTAMVRQFLTDVLWPQLDYLLVDTPPGTSDEHISLLETLLKNTSPVPHASLPYLAGAVIVTTPQAISISDVKKELNFCKKTGIRVLGVVENMAGFVCPNCSECTNVFSKGGGEIMARDFEVPFLGSVPIDPAFVQLVEEGTRPVYPKGTVIEGRDVGGQEVVQNGGPEAKEGLFVDKYRDCSLYPLFDGFVTRLVEDIKTGGQA